MGKVEILVILTVFVPVIGAFTIPIISLISRRAGTFWSVLLAFATAVLPYFLIPFVVSGGEAVFRKEMAFGFDFILKVDALAVFVSIVSSTIGALIVLYSTSYIDREDYRTEYYVMVLLFIGSMMGIVYSANLIFIYLFWEIAAICSWRLIGFYRVREFIVKADKAFLVTFFGAVVMLLGFIQIYGRTGTFDLTAMKGVPIPASAFVLILFGMFSKSATFPLHTWLPDAGIAPSTVTALLHAAVLVKIGVYACARLFCYSFFLPPASYPILASIAIFSSLVAAAAATVDHDIKRILAYSTVSQIGYIFLGISTMNPLGSAGAILFILTHGLAKAGLFLCAGIIEHNTHKKDIRELGGLIKTMPVTAVAFLLCVFSTIGIPPTGGFFSKFMVIAATVKAGQTGIAALALFTAVLTMFYLFRLFNAIFLGVPKTSGKTEGAPVMVFVVTLLALLSLSSGFFVSYPMKLVNVAVKEMTTIAPLVMLK